MPMTDAINFLHDVLTNDLLRDSLNKAPSHQEIITILRNFSYEFTRFEMDDAYRNLLLNCQNEEQAQLIKEIKQWWDLLLLWAPEP